MSIMGIKKIVSKFLLANSRTYEFSHELEMG